MEGIISIVNANVSIKIILKMLHQHPRQLPHQHLNLKNKFINFKNYKKQKKKWWNRFVGTNPE